MTINNEHREMTTGHTNSFLIPFSEKKILFAIEITIQGGGKEDKK